MLYLDSMNTSFRERGNLSVAGNNPMIQVSGLDLVDVEGGEYVPMNYISLGEHVFIILRLVFSYGLFR